MSSRPDDFYDEGRITGARAAELIGNAVIRTEELRWSVDLVKDRVSDAARLCERIVKPAGPSRKTGFWPATEPPEFSTLVAMVKTGDIEKFYRDMNQAPRGGADLREITAMGQAVRWSAAYLAAPEHEEPKRALNAFWFVEARDLNRGDAWKYGGFPSERTYDRRLDRAFEVILAGLERDGVMA